MTNTKVPETMFELAVKARVEQGKRTRDAVELAVTGVDQPVSIAEISVIVQELTGHLYEKTHIKKILNDLSKAGRVRSRYETVEERDARSGGRPVRGTLARLYHFNADGPMPKRTKTSIVPGYVLDATCTEPRRTSAKTSGLPKRVKTLTGSEVDDVISQLIRLKDIESAFLKIRAIIEDVQA